MTYFFIFLVGAILGSFLNIVIYRLPREQKILGQRSTCCKCGVTIRWYDLIPVISYFILKGKCRHCKSKISIQYPTVEILTGMMFVLFYSNYMNDSGLFRFSNVLIFTIVLLCIIGVFTDFLYHGVFDFSTIFVVGIFFVYILIQTRDIRFSFGTLILSLFYIIPIIVTVTLVKIKEKDNLILTIVSFISITVISLFLLLFFADEFVGTTIMLSTLSITMFTGWLLVYVALTLIEYICNTFIIKSSVKKVCFIDFMNWVKFVTFFMFLFNKNYGAVSINMFKGIFSFNIKNICIVIIFTLIYRFMLELFEIHDNDEEILESDEEIMDRDENLFFSYIGDADLFILPFVGMILGIHYTFAFFMLLGIVVLSVYTLIFKKGFRYSIPLYPFIMVTLLSIIIH